MEAGKIRCVPVASAKRFVESCMLAVGCCDKHAKNMADTLIMADHRGHFSHGMNRLDMYVRDVKTGSTEKSGEPIIVKESPGTAFVDGRNLLGPVVGDFCMDIAIKKAKEIGVGWVVATGSNHYGIAGYYALQAASQGLVGLSMTNTSPLVMGTRAKSCTLGTNPISCAAPAQNSDSFVLDMATSGVAIGKVELQKRKGIDIPLGWGSNKDGQVTSDPSEVLNGGGLLPLGGVESTSGYKGYGLSMMVEMMCGIMSGGPFGPNIRRWGSNDRIANLGQCFIAVNPAMFADGFEDRMQDLMDLHRNLDPADKDKPVLVAGDPEREHMAKCDGLGGIPYPENIVTFMNDMGEKIGVQPMEEKKT